MPNVLSVYDPLFYAQEALIQLEKALGLAGRVHRGHDKAPQEKGSKISIRKPSTFVALDAPSTAQDVNAGEVQIDLNFWKEVKFGLTDKELTFTQEDIVREHIRPAAYALADNIDQNLALQYKKIPWLKAASGPAAVADITALQRILFDNQAPENDDNLHLMLSGVLREELLNLAAFSQWQGAGQAGVETQMRGSLGRKYGFEIFANQNVKTHTAGVAADAAGEIAGAHSKGGTTIAFDLVTSAGTFKTGDSFVIAGNTQRYVLTADATASSGAVTATGIFPALVQDYPDNSVITFDLSSGVQSLAFHRNSIALAMAPLSTMGDGLGAKMATVADPKTNLALRSRLFYEGNNSKVFVALDVLYGIQVLDPNLAVRYVD
jgi:hypothetical protein